MRWTADRLDRLRYLAAEGRSRKEVAAAFGITDTALAKAAYRHRVAFDWNREALHALDAESRAKWERLLPELKAGLRRDLQINI